MENQPLITFRTTEELEAERQQLLADIAPPGLEILRRLSDAEATTTEEERILERLKALSWLIDGRTRNDRRPLSSTSPRLRRIHQISP